MKRRRQVGRKGGGLRLPISQFSRRSRRQLLTTLNSVDRVTAPGLYWAFVTLTYHRQDVTPRECKKHLKNLRDSMFRDCPALSFIWKLEPQKRGTPHLHLLAYLPAGLEHDHVRESIMNAWHRIADPESEAHLAMMQFRGWTERAKRREFFQPMKQWSQVSGYAAKYVGKTIDAFDGWGNPGRFWGVHNARGLPRTIVRARVSEAAASWVGRQMRRYLEHVHTGRVDLIYNGKRERLPTKLARQPGFVEGQHRLAEIFNRSGSAGKYEVREYHYRPARNVRNRVGFVPAAVVERLVAAAQDLHPIQEDERREVARLEADHLCQRPTADAAAASRLRTSIARIARRTFLQSRLEEAQANLPPPPPAPMTQRSLFPEKPAMFTHPRRGPIEDAATEVQAALMSTPGVVSTQAFGVTNSETLTLCVVVDNRNKRRGGVDAVVCFGGKWPAGTVVRESQNIGGNMIAYEVDPPAAASTDAEA